MTRAITVNGRRYAWPKAPIVVVCIDGSRARLYGPGDRGRRHALARQGAAAGTKRLADCVVPSFTNPNNLSIVTGVPPAVHGICGNFFYDRQAGTEVMMNDPKYLRAGTILAAFASAGATLAVVTAKDKLRRLLGHGMTGICFSAEKADRPRPRPSMASTMRWPSSAGRCRRSTAPISRSSSSPPASS